MENNFINRHSRGSDYLPRAGGVDRGVGNAINMEQTTEHRLTALESNYKNLCNWVESISEGQKSVIEEVHEIKEKLLNRPSWVVLGIISFLSTITTGLIIYIVTEK